MLMSSTMRTFIRVLLFSLLIACIWSRDNGLEVATELMRVNQSHRHTVRVAPGIRYGSSCWSVCSCSITTIISSLHIFGCGRYVDYRTDASARVVLSCYR